MIKFNNVKKRSGISTVVGSVFFIIAFTTVAGYVVYSMNQLDKFGETIISKSQDDRNIQQEEFKITSVTKDNNKFNITVQNNGQIPVNLTRLWVQNKTDPTWPVSKYTINKIIAPGQSMSTIGQSLPVVAKSNQAYDLTIATQRGNTVEVMVNSASSKPIDLRLFVLPETIPTGFTTTLLFAVTNNMSSSVALTNLIPNLSIIPYGGTATLVSGPEPLQYKFLDKGDTAYFKWAYTITGTPGQRVNFQTSLQNGYLGNIVSKNVTINMLQGIPTVKTVIYGGLTGTITSTSQNYIRFGGESIVSTNNNLKSITMPISGNFTKLNVSKGTGDARATLTLYKNGSPTTLSCQTGTSAPSSCSDTDSISVTSGDTITMGIRMSNNDPSGDITYGLEFDPN